MADVSEVLENPSLRLEALAGGTNHFPATDSTCPSGDADELLLDLTLYHSRAGSG